MADDFRNAKQTRICLCEILKLISILKYREVYRSKEISFLNFCFVFFYYYL